MAQQNNQQSTFTPVHPFDFEDPRTWAGTLGNMDWDTTHICFTKRSLLDFLKHAGVTVGTNYREVSKLPKYATFGTFSKEATEEAVKDLIEAEIADPSRGESPKAAAEASEAAASNDNGFRPSRKVTQRPGGATSISLYDAEYEEEDALSFAPPKPKHGATPNAAPGSPIGEVIQSDGTQTPAIIHQERAEWHGISVTPQ